MTLTLGSGIGLAQALSAQEALAAVHDLPSGLRAQLLEVRRDEGEPERWRFVAPDLPGLVEDLPRLSRDLDALCADVVLPTLDAAEDGVPERVVISLSAEPTEFGAARPGIVQVFEAYSISGDSCIWEAF
ncbi:hypothetical protein ROJ8625_01172 [Roseivivax jejudonensis]|uniref:Acetolactate synthase n=1 Tax=Roseivivax jejudonensis TaxID=1529041 RepID=A0A1X6YQ32_9RHOB|nr:DUF6497 family protein [Roseivivax jejudonensis]SLN28015.1 hypothetical protein ROJ8625_01172 [Roseivivax jejudonensis]